MKRLQKKCFLFSAGFHALLALILVVGPGFFAPKIVSEDAPTLFVIPENVVDGVFRDGGSNSKPTPAPPPPPAPPQESRPAAKLPEPKRAEPDPPKLKETKQETESLDLSHEPRKKKIEISTTPVVRKTNTKPTAKQTSEVDDKARELADARQHAKEALNAAASNLRNSMSSSTSVEYKGEGGYGEAVASYAQVVKSIYEHAWLPPEDAANDDAITKVTVTIANDGKVMESHITRASGDSLVDHSVQRTLDRVIFIRAFPEGAKDKQRTYTINFNLKAKRALG